MREAVNLYIIVACCGTGSSHDTDETEREANMDGQLAVFRLWGDGETDCCLLQLCHFGRRLGHDTCVDGQSGSPCFSNLPRLEFEVALDVASF